MKYRYISLRKCFVIKTKLSAQCSELYVRELQLHFETKNGHGSMVCICLRVIGMKNIPITYMKFTHLLMYSIFLWHKSNMAL